VHPHDTDHRRAQAQHGEPKMSEQSETKSGLSSSKREDLWALIIAAAVMAVAFGAPEGLYYVFKKALFIF
jgi:hypothetical protein